MNFAFSEEQEELRRYARQWLDERQPLSVVREAMETDAGYDRATWGQVAELGWQAMAIPEEHGGAGFGFLEIAVLLEEQGRRLFCGPFLSTVVAAANLILIAGSDAQRLEHLARIASGDITATVAVADDDGGWDGTDLSTAATRTSGGWSLDGTKRFVLDGHTADLLIVAAQSVDGLALFVVDGEAPGVTRAVLPGLDETRKLAEVSLDGVEVPDEARLPNAGVDVLARLDDMVAVAMALEAVGGAEATLDMAVRYAKDREQFGKPIGGFQAVKHQCADMLIAVESARAAAYYAAWAVTSGSDEVSTVVPLAKAHCTEAFFRCAAANIQIHGGIGFTWEHDAHLYFKRARATETLFGSPSERRRQVADALGL